MGKWQRDRCGDTGSESHRCACKQLTTPIIIVLWNVRTLCNNPTTSWPEKGTALVARELAIYKADVSSVSEIRLSHKGQLAEIGAEYTFFRQGRPSSLDFDFATSIFIASKLKSLTKGRSYCLMVLWLPLKHTWCVTIVITYAPTMTNVNNEKAKFYRDLDKLVMSTLALDKVILMGL